MLPQRASESSSASIPWTFLLWVFLFLAVVTTLVPVIDWARRPSGGEFTGFSYESVGDTFVYLNLIEQAKNGASRFLDIYTSNPQQPAIFHPLFLLMGKSAAWLHLSPLVTWHLWRVVLIFPLLLVLWMFLYQFFASIRTKKLLLLAVLFLGLLVSTYGEASLFTSVLFSPKTVLTHTCTFLFFLAFLRLIERPRALWMATLFFLAFLQAFNEPYVLFLWGVVPIAYGFFEVLRDRRMWKSFLFPVILCEGSVLLSVAALGWVVLHNPILAAWSLNAYGHPWKWGTLLLSFGPLIVPACVGGFFFRHDFRSQQRLRFLLFWALGAAAVSLCTAYPFAYRLPPYLQPPLALLAALGIGTLWRRKRAAIAWQAVALALCGLGISDNTYHVAQNITGAYDRTGFRYLSSNEVAGIAWLRRTSPTSVFLASPGWDTLLAGQANRRTFVTPGWQSPQTKEKVTVALDVYAGKMSPPDLSAMMEKNQVDYIVFSECEKLNGHWHSAWENDVFDYDYHENFHAEQYPFLRTVYSNATMTIYQYSP
ncbi:MAG: hypothetical protein V1778_00285 [bacterium]